MKLSVYSIEEALVLAFAFTALMALALILMIVFALMWRAARVGLLWLRPRHSGKSYTPGYPATRKGRMVTKAMIKERLPTGSLNGLYVNLRRWLARVD